MPGVSKPPGLLTKLRPIIWAQVQAGTRWQRERDLSQQQAFILQFLITHPGAIQREIAAASRTTAANVSGVLHGLEARGLVTREKIDDRSKGVFATRQGIDLITGHEEAMAAADEQIIASLSSDEREQLAALLDKITADLPDPQLEA